MHRSTDRSAAASTTSHGSTYTAGAATVIWISPKRTGYDPEVGTVLNRVDAFDLPVFRTLTASLEIVF